MAESNDMRDLMERSGAAIRQSYTSPPKPYVAGPGHTLRGDPDCYAAAFYEIAHMLGISAQPKSPREVWEQQMRPRLKAALDRTPDAIRREIINTPETADFMAGVPVEAAHQRERWGVDHDAGKSPEDWFWLIGYLAQKALRAQNAGDIVKACHHTISTAAALANWHAALTGADTSMRPGIAPPDEVGHE